MVVTLRSLPWWTRGLRCSPAGARRATRAEAPGLGFLLLRSAVPKPQAQGTADPGHSPALLLQTVSESAEGRLVPLECQGPGWGVGAWGQASHFSSLCQVRAGSQQRLWTTSGHSQTKQHCSWWCWVGGGLGVIDYSVPRAQECMEGRGLPPQEETLEPAHIIDGPPGTLARSCCLWRERGQHASSTAPRGPPHDPACPPSLAQVTSAAVCSWSLSSSPQ